LSRRLNLGVFGSHKALAHDLLSSDPGPAEQGYWYEVNLRLFLKYAPETTYS
jgi:hypothetical protein